MKIMSKIDNNILIKGYKLMLTARLMSDLYEKKSDLTSKYVHACSNGHEAIQVAIGLQLRNFDWVYPYYRDDALLLSLGLSPYELMLQLFAKKDDPFSGGRTYYSHPSLNRKDITKIPHQSSATGMQAIPSTGLAMGIKYLEEQNLSKKKLNNEPIVVCSLGDAAISEGEISEAFQISALKQLPIIFLVQDNEWDISAKSDEIRSNDVSYFIKGFKGIESIQVNGSDFEESYTKINEVINKVRKKRVPYLIHAKVPLLGHHTSGVRKEWYRNDLLDHKKRDPIPILEKLILKSKYNKTELDEIKFKLLNEVKNQFEDAKNAKEPDIESIFDHEFAPTKILNEIGTRKPNKNEKIVMVDAALYAMKEILNKHPEALFYGQDVGLRLGGVFREAATLAEKFGCNRVFNTPIQEAFIIGSTVGMSAAGCKPIVEVQFADYLWPGLNQLFTEVSRSCYLSNGKWPVNALIRVPVGAYGSGGPYHSSSIESILTNIKGIKVVYPSNAADMKGLMKSGFYDPNPVIILEHKGLYWSKIEGTEDSKTIEPDEDYIIPIGKSNIILEADEANIISGKSLLIISYGMGIYWSKNAAKNFEKQIEILDLRTLIPMDLDKIYTLVKKHSKCIIVTEESEGFGFSEALAGKIQENCFDFLDAPIKIIGSKSVPAIPLNSNLEAAILPNSKIVEKMIKKLLKF